MNKIILSGIHLELTDALKAKVEEKAQKLFGHKARIVRLRVELSAEQKQSFIAKGHLEMPRESLIVSKKHRDLYKAIDMMIEGLDRQLRKIRAGEKHKRHHPHGVDIPAEIPKIQS